MKVRCPVCKNNNLLSDDEISGFLFSLHCEKCEQLLSVKISVQALNVVKTASAKTVETDNKNRVSTWIKNHMDQLNLPVLPVLATKIREARKNENCSIDDVVALVQTDQIIASRILALANSAMYGGLVEITDMMRAINRLGLNVTETLVQALENKRIYSTENHHVKKILEDLWMHALGTALTSQTIAQDLKMDNVAEIFTSGLLHDFGYVLFVQALIQAKDFKVDLSSMNVKEFMEVAFEDHAKLGAYYLKEKGLPKALTTIIACHEDIPEEEAGNNSLHVVALANQLCKKVGLGPTHDPDIRLELTESAQILGFNELKLADLEVKCEDMVKQVAACLE